jgi:hypothetical protein
MPVGADPELITHRAYGLPSGPVPPEMWDAAEQAARRELRLATSPPEGAYAQLGRHDGYQVSAEDQADFGRHQAQLTGQFLIDRAGMLRWSYVECAREGLESMGKLAPAEEILAAVEAL